MSRGRCTFRQRDLTRAVKGAIDAGLPIERIRITVDRDGTIIVSTGPDSAAVDTKPADEVPYL